MLRTCTCPDDALCPACYGHALFAARPQAVTLGACWAERVARTEHRRRAAWPTEGKVLDQAARQVASLAADPRLRAELAAACMEGAAAWWAARPARYR